MRYYSNLDLGVVVMSNVAGYQYDKITEGLVSACTHEKRSIVMLSSEEEQIAEPENRGKL